MADGDSFDAQPVHIAPAALSDDRSPDAIRTMRGASTHLARGLQAAGAVGISTAI
jgi:hypothetical protein